jgi:hypothetical protein
MSIQALLEQYDLFDNAILSHGFTDYNRDYRITAELGLGGGPAGVYEFLFRGCVAATYECMVPPAGYSVNDDFIDFEQWEAAGAPDGFVWAQPATIYPGWQLLAHPDTATRWAARLGIPMQEILIETNAFTLRLVFHDLAIKQIVGDQSV